MATFKEISAADVKTSRSSLNQLVDIIQEDISGSATRRKYQVFVTGGIGPGVTSSLFQTVYDQDFTLQTANPLFDMTVGLFYSGSTVLDCQTAEDSAGKLLFPSTSLMMREKIDVYKQFAQTLLGNAQSSFFAPFGSALTTNRINEALFLNVKRLFSRDKIKRETFAIRAYQSGAQPDGSGVSFRTDATATNERGLLGTTLNTTSTGSMKIFTDVGAAANKRVTFGGEVGNIVDSSDISAEVGLMFYDQGIVVLDAAKVFAPLQPVSGVIDAMSSTGMGSGATSFNDVASGKTLLGGPDGQGNPNALFVPDFFVSASIDNIIDTLAATRFQSGSLTAMTFQNVTNINSTLFFIRSTADEFNYSSNPTYIDSDDRIVVIEAGEEDTQRSFTFPTAVGLYDANDNLLAVAKLSRPVEKNDEKDLTIRIRLDF
ncbi:MAG TPA: hypothetical protein EYG51_08840 [Pseudomonadales bacterium]|nr:hypothetical protein [Pseudomonadales bacterium]